MAKIVISEVSQNYSWSIGANNYATVALPITSSWGPGYFDPYTFYSQEEIDGMESPEEAMLEHTVWQRYPATQAGLDSFVATYRGPASNYRLAKDFSYQQAITLLTAGYDVLVCRLCPGKQASGVFVQYQGKDNGTTKKAEITFKAKYPGTFGNNIQIAFNKAFYYDGVDKVNKYYWNIITYVIDAGGVKTAVESKTCVFKLADATDSILYYKEVESNFWTIDSIDGDVVASAEAAGMMTPDADYATSYDNASEYDSSIGYTKGYIVIHDNILYEASADIASPAGDWNSTKWTKVATSSYMQLGSQDGTKGTDYDVDTDRTQQDFENITKPRFQWAADYQQVSYDTYAYPAGGMTYPGLFDSIDADMKKILYYREWVFKSLVGSTTYNGVFDLLKDKLAYNPNRIISPGWDDQDYYMYTDEEEIINSVFHINEDYYKCQIPVSPIHLKIMDVAYYGRCATGYIDVPHLVGRNQVHIEDESNPDHYGYVQELARVTPSNAALDVNGTLYHTHCAFFAPWAQFQYVGTSKMNVANPSFLALMIQRAQILNQATQYEWALPTNRKHNLRIGKLDYTVPKKLLDRWQKLEGASVNVITTIPDLGTNIWGNSTLYEVPPATYQALANLSTRFLVNAVEDTAYRCGIGITFQYNNGQAYNKFYAGVTPLLDTMRNVGAIDDYRVEMSADINGLDRVNANTVIGKIWLVVNGVINDIYVDLVALPAGAGIDLASLS